MNPTVCHPREGGDPGTYWIPAFAGMTTALFSNVPSRMQHYTSNLLRKLRQALRKLSMEVASATGVSYIG